jgi:hypothetical protein
MSESESARRRIAETFIAAYYLAHFFTYLQEITFTVDQRWRYLSFPNPQTLAALYGLIYLGVGIGILLQANWGRILGVMISLLMLVSLWWLFRPVRSWATVAVSTLINVAIVCYFVNSWWRGRSVSNSA